MLFLKKISAILIMFMFNRRAKVNTKETLAARAIITVKSVIISSITTKRRFTRLKSRDIKTLTKSKIRLTQILKQLVKPNKVTTIEKLAEAARSTVVNATKGTRLMPDNNRKNNSQQRRITFNLRRTTRTVARQRWFTKRRKSTTLR